MRNKLSMHALLSLACCLAAAFITASLLSAYYSREHFRELSRILNEITADSPEAEQAVASALKAYESGIINSDYENIIQKYGYGQEDFLKPAHKYVIPFAAVGFAVGGILFAAAIFGIRKKESGRIKKLTVYLENVNSGKGGILPESGGSAFLELEDEIYKTVTELNQTKDYALKAKNNYAENLYNIAHQIKTPITAASLSVQMMRKEAATGAVIPGSTHLENLEQIEKQLLRLTGLEESLLLLSRIDSGTLEMKTENVDVFTLLTLAADNLCELLSKACVSVNIPEGEAVSIRADINWTMEAVMNLIKNCMEHTPPGGIVSCSYEQNPLYTRIRIWDTGSGFAKEDIPHLFERFYRGRERRQEAQTKGTGIGLAISKAVIESQNGTISAENLTGGGACFEIRFYSH